MRVNIFKANLQVLSQRKGKPVWKGELPLSEHRLHCISTVNSAHTKPGQNHCVSRHVKIYLLMQSKCDKIKILRAELILRDYCTFPVISISFCEEFFLLLAHLVEVWFLLPLCGNTMLQWVVFSLISPALCSLWSFHEHLLNTAMFSEGNISTKDRESLGDVQVFFLQSWESSECRLKWRDAVCLAVWLLGTDTEPADLICS